MPFDSFNALAVSTDAILGDALAPYALFSRQGRIIGTIAIDVPIREVHEDAYVITQHPVETGTPVSDHYYRQPQQLEMTCGFSDSTAGFEGYVSQVYQAFLDLADTREPFSVSSGKRQYNSLMIADLGVVTDSQSEHALFITVRLQEVIITSTDGGDSAGPQGTASNQANPAETGTTENTGAQTTLPYFASGQLPSGYSPIASTGSGVGAAGIGGSPFNFSGPAT